MIGASASQGTRPQTPSKHPAAAPSGPGVDRLPAALQELLTLQGAAAAAPATTLPMNCSTPDLQPWGMLQPSVGGTGSHPGVLKPQAQQQQQGEGQSAASGAGGGQGASMRPSGSQQQVRTGDARAAAAAVAGGDGLARLPPGGVDALVQDTMSLLAPADLQDFMQKMMARMGGQQQQ